MATSLFETGLVSVTFRDRTIYDILGVCAENALSEIEIGSDVHAPKEDISGCEKIKEAAAARGVKIVSYGTYYRLGEYSDPEKEFDAYLDAADALGTTNLRLWAGNGSSRTLVGKVREKLTAEARLLAEKASERKKTISFEYHGGTLTDDADSALRLMRDIGRPNAYLYWQPSQYLDTDSNVEALRKVLPFVSNIHVFAWDARGGELIKFPLSDYAEQWKRYLDILVLDKRKHSLLLEFVKDGSKEQLSADAAALNEWTKVYKMLTTAHRKGKDK